MTSEVFSYTLTVPSSAIDVRNHINNLAYLEWCLRAAEEHWEKNASTEIRNHYVWYVLHHSIDYKAAAFEGEELGVQTWVVSAEGVKSKRQYRIYRTSDKKTLIEAKTLWCLLDAKTLRPAKIPEEIRNLF
ncbi:MAG: thioesterase family protein [Bacteroidota bacterium]